MEHPIAWGLAIIVCLGMGIGLGVTKGCAEVDQSTEIQQCFQHPANTPKRCDCLSSLAARDKGYGSDLVSQAEECRLAATPVSKKRRAAGWLIKKAFSN